MCSSRTASRSTCTPRTSVRRNSSGSRIVARRHLRRQAGARRRAGVDAVINFAGDDPRDRSILDPDEFLRTDVSACTCSWRRSASCTSRACLHISTDEVYAPSRAARPSKPRRCGRPTVLGRQGERRSPGAGVLEHARSCRSSSRDPRTTSGRTSIPRRSSRCFVTNALEDQPLPLYGDGRQVRDWLYVLEQLRGDRPGTAPGPRRATSTTSAVVTRSRTSR